MGVNVKVPRKTLNEFCRRNQIRKLLFFGSVLRDDFTDRSDVDVLVEFDENAKIGLIGLAGLEIELSEILGRNVEMHTVKGLNRHFRTEVLKTAAVQYEQA